MSPVVRVLVIALVQLTLVFFAGWFAFNPDSLGSDLSALTSRVSRIGLVLLCLVAAVLTAELAKLRTHMSMLLGALRAASGGPGVPGAQIPASAGAAAADPRAAVDILLQALASDDAETSKKAHQHLKRLTGKDLPPETALWERWWQENRENFPSGR